MTDPSISDRLRAMDARLVPDPTFAAALRVLVADELRASKHVGAAPTEAEGNLMTITFTRPAPQRSRRRGLLLGLAAAAAIVVALVVVHDDSPATHDGVESVDAVDVPTPAPSTLDGPASTGARAEVHRTGVDTPGLYRVATTDAGIWVGSLSGALTLIDDASGDVLATAQMAESSLIAGGHGSLWVADAVDGSVRRLDAATGTQVVRIDTGIRVDDVTFRRGRLAMLEGARRRFSRIGSITVTDTAVWVGDQEGRVLEIDPATSSLRRAIQVDIGADLVRAHGNMIAVGDQITDRAVVLDANTGDLVADLGDFDVLLGLDVYEDVVYVHEGGSATVFRTDLVTGTTIASDDLADATVGPGAPIFPMALRVNDAGVFVSSRSGLQWLDRRTLRAIAVIDVDTRAGEVIVVGPSALAASEFNGSSLARIEVSNR